MPRTRKILIDNTTGIIYTNVTQSAGASPDKVIAAKIAKGLQIEAAAPGVNVKPLVATKYWRSQSSVLITDMTLSMRAKTPSANPAPRGDRILTVVLRVTDRYGNNAIEHGPYTVDPNSTTSEYYPNIRMAPDQRLYMDIVAVGNVAPGQGLIGLFQFYQGV